MKQQTGETYQSSDYAKALWVSEAKVGKTVFAILSALGIWPGQKYGGVVDRPEHLHVVSLDAAAVRGAQKFMQMIHAPKEAFKFTVHNLEEDLRRVSTAQEDWDYTLWNALMEVFKKIQGAAASGTSMVIVSSLSSLALGLERALAGPPGMVKFGKEVKGSGMDQSKWSDLARQLNEARNLYQTDRWHCFWEGHIYKPPKTGQGQQEEERKETLQVSGKGGYNFPNNVEQIFRIRRLEGQTYETASKVDKMYIDTRPSLEFIAGGRGFTEDLDPKEYDLTLSLYKLGLKVGRWGAKKEKKK